MKKKNSKPFIFLTVIAITIAITWFSYNSIKNTDSHTPTKKNTQAEVHSQSINNVNKIETAEGNALTENELIAKAKQEVAIEYERLSRKSVYYPDSPLDAYLKHIELAESGDVDSQYIIYKIAERCGNYPYSQEILDQIKEGNDHMRSYNFAMFFNEECTALTQNTEINAKSKKQWHKKLIENKHPVSIVKDLITIGVKNKVLNDKTFKEFTPSTVSREVLINSLRTVQNRNEAISQVGTYLSIYHEFDLANEATAWSIANCINREECTSGAHRQIYRDSLQRRGYQPHQIDQFFEQGQQYLDLIENEQWNEILTTLNNFK